MRTIHEGAHKAGCACGFCKNKGKIHMRGKDKESAKDDTEKKPTAESIVAKMLEEE